MWPDISNVVERCDTYDLLQYATIAITGYSNTGYEAMSIGVPTLIVNVGPYQELYRGCGVDIYDLDNLAEEAAEIIVGNYDKVGLKAWLDNHYYSDGRSTIRIADRVETLGGEWGL
jgi:hypothetical protein